MKDRNMVTLAAALLCCATVAGAGQEGPQMEMADPSGDGTTIVGAEEAPTVLNVVPWQDSRVELERDDPSSALLSRVLEPLDRDVLKREIEYHHMLTTTDEDDGLFLD